MADDIKSIVKLILDDAQFQKGVKGVATKAKKAGKQIKKSFGSNAVKDLKRFALGFVGITVALAGVIKIAGAFIRVNKEFEKGIADVAAVSGESRIELSKLARIAGKDTVFSATQAAGALKLLAQAGLNLKDSQDVLIPTLNLATAASIDIASATNILVSQLKTFQVETSESERFVDILAKTTQSSNTNMEELGNALSFAGASAKLVGASFEDTNAILGALADVGIKGTRAGTQLRQAFSQLLAPTSAAKEALARYGITQREINTLLPTPIKLLKRLNEANITTSDGLKILGVRQQNVFGLIKAGIPSIEKLRDKIGEAGGAAQKAADIQLDTLDGKLKLLNSAWEELNLTIGEGGNLNKGLKAIVGVLTDIVLATAEWINSTAGVRTIAVIMGAVELVFKTTWLGIKLNFFVPIKTATILLIQQFKSLGSTFKNLATGNIKAAFNEIANLGGKSTSIIVEGTKEIVEGYKTLGGTAVKVFDNVVNAQAKSLGKLKKNRKSATKEAQDDAAREFEALAAQKSLSDEEVKQLDKLLKDGLKLNDEELLMFKIEQLNRFAGFFEEGSQDLMDIDEARAKFQADLEEKTTKKHRDEMKKRLDIVKNFATLTQKTLEILNDFIEATIDGETESRRAARLAQIDTNNEFADALKILAEEERLAKIEALKLELIDAIAANNKLDEADIRRKLRRLDLEKKSSVRENEIKAETAQVNSEIDDEAGAKKRKALKGLAIAERAAAVFSIGVRTAQAVIGFLANPSGPAGIALSVLAGIQGTAAAITTAAKPLGFRGGTDFVRNDMTANIHQGERILRKDQNLPNVSNADFFQGAVRGLGFPEAVRPNISTVSNATENNDNRSTTNNFSGIRNMEQAMNAQRRRSGQEAFV